MDFHGGKGLRETKTYICPDKLKESIMMVVSAPSGAGKTTICRKLLSQFPDLKFSVSCTTRPPRRGEREGVDYHFISEDKFREKIQNGTFVEYEENHSYLYGTSKDFVEELINEGKDILFDIDIRGAKAIKQYYSEAVSVVILPPSLEELTKRLENRGSENADTLRIRLQRALEEIEDIRFGEWYDYMILNDQMKDAIETLKAVYTAEKSKRKRQKNILSTLFKD